MKLMVETFHSDINLADMGGFSTLILCSFHGFMEGVQFAIQHGADIYLKGKLRSGVALTAEHWAAVRGHYHIFDYLRSIRLRDQKKRLSQLTQQKSSVQDESITSPQDDTLNDKNERNHINTASFNYDNATFEEIFLVGNNPTLENIDEKLPKNSINLVAAVPDGNNNVATKKNVPFPSSSSSGSAPCDGSFCICGRGFVGNMVACDMADCPIEWYHFECVGLTKEVSCLS
jgi:ankyrin repeat protein